MTAEVEGQYGGPVKLDMVRVKQAKEMAEKDKKIEELERKMDQLIYAVRNHTDIIWSKMMMFCRMLS